METKVTSISEQEENKIINKVMSSLGIEWGSILKGSAVLSTECIFCNDRFAYAILVEPNRLFNESNIVSLTDGQSKRSVCENCGSSIPPQLFFTHTIRAK